MYNKPSALVVGSGVVGLATALRLHEHGLSVTVVRDREWAQTCSIGAGAIWEYPPFKIMPKEKAVKWLWESRKVLEAFLAEDKNCGVVLRSCHYYSSSGTAVDIPEGAADVPGFSSNTTGPKELYREGVFGSGYSYEVDLCVSSFDFNRKLIE